MNDVFRSEPQDRKLLDEAAPNNPVLLMDETGHSSWASSMALQLAGITRDTANPLNGSIGPGLLADLIVLDRNPFKVPVTTVHETKVETAIINGEIVYEMTR